MTESVVPCFRAIRFSPAWSKRVAVSEIVFQPGVNVLAGPNGSGKSSVLQAILDAARHRPDRSEGVEVAATTEPVRTMYLDFEKMNPRVGSQLREGAELFQIRALFSSHGETTRAILADLGRNRKQFEGCCVLLDEPEQALDLDGLILLGDMARAAIEVAGAHQVIIATHAPNLILAPDLNVIELVPGYRDRVQAWASGLGAREATR